jgi:transposase-like protein
MKCPKCGKEMDFYEKDTSSGRDMRTYVCRPCKEYVDVDNGVALWQVLHDARKDSDQSIAREERRGERPRQFRCMRQQMPKS